MDELEPAFERVPYSTARKTLSSPGQRTEGLVSEKGRRLQSASPAV
jgi:hypothetical protein